MRRHDRRAPLSSPFGDKMETIKKFLAVGPVEPPLQPPRRIPSAPMRRKEYSRRSHRMKASTRVTYASITKSLSGASVTSSRSSDRSRSFPPRTRRRCTVDAVMRPFGRSDGAWPRCSTAGSRASDPRHRYTASTAGQSLHVRLLGPQGFAAALRIISSTDRRRSTVSVTGCSRPAARSSFRSRELRVPYQRRTLRQSRRMRVPPPRRARPPVHPCTCASLESGRRRRLLRSPSDYRRSNIHARQIDDVLILAPSA